MSILTVLLMSSGSMSTTGTTCSTSMTRQYSDWFVDAIHAEVSWILV